LSRPLQLTQWHQTLASRFPDLPASYVFVLAMYSLGAIAAHTSGLTSVAFFLAKLLGFGYHAIRKRLREFYQEADAKSGQQRQDFDVSSCFNPLLRWILSMWPSHHLPLAIDVTNLGSRFHVLCISVVVGGNGIPVAWVVLLGEMKDPWNPHWRALLQRLHGQLPPSATALASRQTKTTPLPSDLPKGLTVIVLCDRGLESIDLFGYIKELGWHPFMRIKKGGKFRPAGWGQFHSLSELVNQIGSSYSAEGCLYESRQVNCTLLAMWQAGHEEPWFVITDLPPEAASVLWYGFRTWIEQGFKIIKGGGFHWDKTRMEDPQRVERLWLVLAVACLWVVAVGGEDEIREQIDKELQELEKEMREGEEKAQQRQAEERARTAKRIEASKQATAERMAKKQADKQAKAQEQAQKAAKAMEAAATKQARKEMTAKKDDSVKKTTAELEPEKYTQKEAEGNNDAAKKAEKTADGEKEGKKTGQEGAEKQGKQKNAKKGKQQHKGKREEWKKQREHRVFRRGLTLLHTLWQKGQNLLPQRLYPDPWPPPSPFSSFSEEEFFHRPSAHPALSP